MSTTAAKMQVPLLDLKQQHLNLRDELRAALTRVLDSQQFVLGEDVRLLESELARYTRGGLRGGGGGGAGGRPGRAAARARARAAAPWTWTRAPTTSTRRGLKKPSRSGRAPSSPSTSTASWPRWERF